MKRENIQLQDILQDINIKNNIDNMLKEFKKEPLEYKQTYKKLKTYYYRDTIYNTWCAYIFIPAHFYTYNINNKVKEIPLPRKRIYDKFPELTFYSQINKVQRQHRLGLKTIGLSPNNYQLQLLELTKRFPDYLTKQEKLETLYNYKYVSLKEIKNKVHEIINYIQELCTPQDLKTTKCYKCKKEISLVGHRIDSKGNIVCSKCGKYLKEGRFVPKCKLKKGKFYTKQINGKTYYACHVCGFLTKNLFTHSTTKHNISRDEYSKLFDIDFTLPRSKGGYYENRNVYINSKPRRQNNITTNTKN